MKAIPPDFSIIKLTPERLQLLYGDLSIDIKDIAELTGSTYTSIRKMAKEAGIKKGYPVRNPWTRHEYERLAELLPIRANLATYSYAELRAELRAALFEKIRSNSLSWIALDQFIGELPAMQEEEQERLRKFDEKHDSPASVSLTLLVKRPHEKTYLARRSATGKARALIKGNLMRGETVGDAALRILRTEAGFEATFTDVLAARATTEEKGIAMHLIVVLTITDPKAAPKKPKGEWRWVHFSKLLSPWRYPMLNYL